MYTDLTLIFLYKDVQEDARRFIRRAKFTKNYRFSLRGWASARLLAVDLSRGAIVTNAAAKELRPLFTKLIKDA